MDNASSTPAGGDPSARDGKPAPSLPNEGTIAGGSEEGGENRGGAGRIGWAFLILLWGYAIYRLGTLWYAYEQYSYGWFVPLLCLLLFLERWRRRPRKDSVRAGLGTGLVWAALALLALPAIVALEAIPFWRLAGWLLALVLVSVTVIGLYFLGGRSYSRHFLFPVLFFLVAVPWPDRFEDPGIDRLSRLNAAISTKVVNFMGTPAVRHGVLIETGAGLVGVDTACSGIRSFQSSVMIGLFLGELLGYGFLRRSLLLFGGMSVAFACNVVRTTYLVRVADLKGLEAVNLRHDQAGFTIMGATFVGLLLLAWLLRPKAARGTEMPSAQPESTARTFGGTSRDEATNPLANTTREPQSPPAILPPVTPQGRLQFALGVFLAWILVIEAGLELWFKPMERRAAATSLWQLKPPSNAREFNQAAIPVKMQNLLQCDEGSMMQWRDALGHPWQLYSFRWQATNNRFRAAESDSQARGHAPDACLLKAGMTLRTNLGTTVTSVNGVVVRNTIQGFLAEGRNLHVLSAYWQADERALESMPDGPTSTTLALRRLGHVLKTRDRGRSEKRTMRVGVWDMESDAAAQAAFQEHLAQMIVRE